MDHYEKNAGTDAVDWSALSPEEKKKQLFLKQKRLLDTFLEHGALTRAQHDYSLHCLAEKMDMTDLLQEDMPDAGH